MSKAAKKPTKRAADPLEQLRRICLALPEAHEVLAWGEPTFRIRNRMFATYAAPNNHHGGGRPAAWCKATHQDQDFRVRAEPDRYFVPPYVGPSGWVGVYLDQRPSWRAIGSLIEESYRLVAPKRLGSRPTDSTRKPPARR